MHLLLFPYLFNNPYLLFHVSSGQNFVTTHNWTQVFKNSFDHKDLGNHLLQLCPQLITLCIYIVLFESYDVAFMQRL